MSDHDHTILVEVEETVHVIDIQVGQSPAVIDIEVSEKGLKGDKGDPGIQGIPGDKGDPGDPATNLVTSVNGKQGDVVVNKVDVGLSSVDNTSDANKPISSATSAALSGKVDKVSGKGLSTEDFTTTEKSKLSGIAEGAEVNVQADWNEANSSSDAFIKNKPTIPSGLTPATSVVNETSYGQAPSVGISTDYARADHTHGTPAGGTGISEAQAIAYACALGGI